MIRVPRDWVDRGIEGVILLTRLALRTGALGCLGQFCIELAIVLLVLASVTSITLAQQPKLTFKEIIDLRNDIPSLVGLPGGPLGIGIAYDPFKDRIIFTAGFPIGKLVILQRDPKDATKIKAVLADINFDVGDPTTSREGKVAVVPLEAQKAGFTPGEIFATRPRAKDINGNSIPFTEVYRIIEDKKDHFVPILFAKLPTNPELGARAIDFDKVGTWGNAMLVTTTDGKVFKVTPDPTSDPPSKVEQIIDLGIDPKKNIIEGITVAPQGFGPIGGDIIIGHDCQVLAIAPDKTVTVVVDGFKTLPRLVFPDGRPDERTCVEDLDFVPEGENLFVTTDSESRNPNAKPPLPVQDFLVVALLDQFKNQGLIGHLLVTIENPNQIWDVFFDSTTQQFVKRPLAKGLNEQEPSENDSSSGLLLHGEHVSFGKVINRAPTAPPIPDIVQVQECTSVTIDGSGATDPDGDKLSFKWELIAAPPGVRVPRTLSASPKLTFSPTQPGIYRVRLTVSDGRGGTATVETSINVIPSLGCDFIPGEKDFELMMNALVHHIYEVIVDTNHARNLISQNRSETLIADSIDQALELMAEIPADFAELFGQLDNMDETLTEFLTLVEARAEDADITPLQQTLFIKIKNKLEMMQTILLDIRDELDSLRDTLDAGDASVADVRQALEQARAAVNDGDLASAKSALNDAYQRLRIARREQARVLAKEKIVQRRFIEINGILPRAFAVLNDDPKVIPATPSAQPIRLQTDGSISLWILPQRDGSFTLQAQSTNVKTIRLEMYALSGERLVLRSANGSVVTVKPTDEQGHSLANGVYLILITVETKGHQIERQVHKITVLQK